MQYFSELASASTLNQELSIDNLLASQFFIIFYSQLSAEHGRVKGYPKRK